MPSVTAFHSAKIASSGNSSNWAKDQRDIASNACCKNICYYFGIFMLIMGILAVIMGIAFAVKYPLPAIGFAFLLVGLTIIGDYCGCR